MTTSYLTPGVYIVELPATGPIAGVGTSTPAFIGPAALGPLFTPTKITNWTQFKEIFGGYLSAPRQFLAYAVEGFFRNGGVTAYIVRVGTAARASKLLDDRLGNPGALLVQAQLEGTAGNLIRVQVQNAQIVTAAAALKAQGTTASASNNKVTMATVADADKFRSGDVVSIDGTAERATVVRVRNADVILDTNLTATYAAVTLRIADLTPGQLAFRVQTPAGIEAGSILQITQGATTERRVVERVFAGFVQLSTPLVNTYTMDAASAAVGIQSFEFTLTILVPSKPNQVFDNLSMSSRHSRYFAKIAISPDVLVTLPATPSTAPPPDNRPAVMGATALAGGTADNLAAINAVHYSTGIDTLQRVDDVNLVCVPDRTDVTVQQAVITHCQNMADRFAILDSIRGAVPTGPGSVLEQRGFLESARGYAGLYYPWMQIPDPEGSNGDLLLIPPSGHIAGIFARTDQQRGVHKAPANEMIEGVVKLERVLTDADQGGLNIEGINVLRVLQGRARPTVWGARTTAPAAETPWRYINVRRLFLYIEESIQEGIRWAVFEPNDVALWEKLKRTISEFLGRVWRSGALFGAVADQAYYVKCDEELNPPAVRALGQVIIEIGIAPVRPAEFVIVRIGMWEGGAQITEP